MHWNPDHLCSYYAAMDHAGQHEGMAMSALISARLLLQCLQYRGSRAYQETALQFCVHSVQLGLQQGLLDGQHAAPHAVVYCAQRLQAANLRPQRLGPLMQLQWSSSSEEVLSKGILFVSPT